MSRQHICEQQRARGASFFFFEITITLFCFIRRVTASAPWFDVYQKKKINMREFVCLLEGWRGVLGTVARGKNERKTKLTEIRKKRNEFIQPINAYNEEEYEIKGETDETSRYACSDNNEITDPGPRSM